MQTESLAEHIKENFSSKAEFAKFIGVSASQVHYMVRNGYIVHSGKIYAPRHDIKNSAGIIEVVK